MDMVHGGRADSGDSTDSGCDLESSDGGRSNSGMVRGVCEGDTEDSFIIIEAGDRCTPPRGASDAVLAPYHIDRAKIYAHQRFASSKFINEERIVEAIEMTRFPVPNDPRPTRSPTPSRRWSGPRT